MTKPRGDKPKRVIKKLEGWMTLPEAAIYLGVSRARLFQMVDEHAFSDPEVRRVDGVNPDRPAAILVRSGKVRMLKERQDAEAARQAGHGEEPALAG